MMVKSGLVPFFFLDQFSSSYSTQNGGFHIWDFSPLILGVPIGGAIGVAYQGINTLISRELSEGQWHQVLTFASDTGIEKI